MITSRLVRFAAACAAAVLAGCATVNEPSHTTLIAHRGEWHGRRFFSEEIAAKEFPLPFAFGDRLFAEPDGTASVLFSRKDVSSRPAFGDLVESGRKVQ